MTRLKRPAGFDETWIDDAECYGHNSGDVQPFHDLFPDYDEDLASGSEASSGLPGAGDDVHEVGRPKSYYSNRDLYDLLHPGETNCPYIYDNFEWPHCDVSANKCVFFFFTTSERNSALFVLEKFMGKRTAFTDDALSNCCPTSSEHARS